MAQLVLNPSPATREASGQTHTECNRKPCMPKSGRPPRGVQPLVIPDTICYHVYAPERAPPRTCNVCAAVVQSWVCRVASRSDSCFGDRFAQTQICASPCDCGALAAAGSGALQRCRYGRTYSAWLLGHMRWYLQLLALIVLLLHCTTVLYYCTCVRICADFACIWVPLLNKVFTFSSGVMLRALRDVPCRSWCAWQRGAGWAAGGRPRAGAFLQLTAGAVPGGHVIMDGNIFAAVLPVWHGLGFHVPTNMPSAPCQGARQCKCGRRRPRHSLQKDGNCVPERRRLATESFISLMAPRIPLWPPHTRQTPQHGERPRRGTALGNSRKRKAATCSPSFLVPRFKMEVTLAGTSRTQALSHSYSGSMDRWRGRHCCGSETSQAAWAQVRAP